MKISRLNKSMMAIAICFTALTSCDNNDDPQVIVPEAVQTAFNKQYAGATRLGWDLERGNYIVAEFEKDGKEYSAWYTPDGQWMMTEVDYGNDIRTLPQAVQDGYNATTYARQRWTVEDIDEIQRPDYESIFKIEVEKQGQPDFDLYFDLNGTLMREVQDSDNEGSDDNENMIQTQLPQQIQSVVDTKYPGATVVDFEKERNGYEVDIRHDNKSKELLFSTDYAWIQTSTDLSHSVPDNIRAAVNTKYPGKTIDDCDHVETAANESYYLVDLDDYDKDLKIAPDGTITEVND